MSHSIGYLNGNTKTEPLIIPYDRGHLVLQQLTAAGRCLDMQLVNLALTPELPCQPQWSSTNVVRLHVWMVP